MKCTRSEKQSENGTCIYQARFNFAVLYVTPVKAAYSNVKEQSLLQYGKVIHLQHFNKFKVLFKS